MKDREREENIAALRRMWVIFWVAVAFVFDCLCLWAGLFIGWKVYGGG